ncbi:MAG: hypothetical protein HQL31_03045 [Planctomycetes bacterium]|nr:hypothetical protein [Planctomycetota bacterium]
MILVTVGAQLPFDRLIRAVDRWAGDHQVKDIFAQIGQSDYIPQNMPYAKFLDYDQFHEKISQCTLLISHAGMGSIITAMELGKPVLMMPRRADLGEHRNDHQLATSASMKERGRLEVAMDEEELYQRLCHPGELHSSASLAPCASGALIKALREFVERGSKNTGRKVRVLALSSGGGHWIQLKRLSPAFTEHSLMFSTVDPAARGGVNGHPFFTVPDANRWQKLRLIWCALSVISILLRSRAEVILSTGAAPGYFAILFGKCLGRKTIWVDSIANAAELSLSGRKALKIADLTLTQWPQLEEKEGPFYAGDVL